MKKISVSFTCEINLKDESNIDVDCVRDTMCLAFGSVVSNWTDDAKSELALAFRNALAVPEKSVVKIESLGIEHECKDEIEARILELKDNQIKFINIIRKVKDEFNLTLKQAVDFVRLYFPR